MKTSVKCRKKHKLDDSSKTNMKSRSTRCEMKHRRRMTLSREIFFNNIASISATALSSQRRLRTKRDVQKIWIITLPLHSSSTEIYIREGIRIFHEKILSNILYLHGNNLVWCFQHLCVCDIGFERGMGSNTWMRMSNVYSTSGRGTNE